MPMTEKVVVKKGGCRNWVSIEYADICKIFSYSFKEKNIAIYYKWHNPEGLSQLHE